MFFILSFTTAQYQNFAQMENLNICELFNPLPGRFAFSFDKFLYLKFCPSCFHHGVCLLFKILNAILNFFRDSAFWLLFLSQIFCHQTEYFLRHLALGHPSSRSINIFQNRASALTETSYPILNILVASRFIFLYFYCAHHQSLFYFL